MFRKILKYDLLSVWKLWWLLAVSVLGLSFIAAFVLRFVITYIENDNLFLLVLLGILFLFVSAIAIFGSVVVTQILTYYRYYKNFFTDEGYLTFTLPVKRRQLYLSKLLNTVIWQAAHISLYIVCLLIFLIITPPADKGMGFFNPVAFETIGDMIAEAWDAIGAWLIVYIIEALVCIFGILLCTNGLILFCITLGAVLAKKAKLIASIGIYYLVNMVFSWVIQLSAMFAIPLLSQGIVYYADRMTANHAFFVVALAVGIIALLVLCLGMVINFITIDKLERKLNLT